MIGIMVAAGAALLGYSYYNYKKEEKENIENAREIQKHSKEKLDAGKILHLRTNSPGFAKQLISMAYDGIDFDSNFIMKEDISYKGPFVYVKKISTTGKDYSKLYNSFCKEIDKMKQNKK